MARTAARLRQEGCQVVLLDLTALGQNVTPEQWYLGLLESLGAQLGLEDELEEFWLDQERLAPFQRWQRALREVVLPALTERDEWRVASGEGTETPTPDPRPPTSDSRHPSPVTRYLHRRDRWGAQPAVLHGRVLGGDSRGL
jgi:hypothetical protein